MRLIGDTPKRLAYRARLHGFNTPAAPDEPQSSEASAAPSRHKLELMRFAQATIAGLLACILAGHLAGAVAIESWIFAATSVLVLATVVYRQRVAALEARNDAAAAHRSVIHALEANLTRLKEEHTALAECLQLKDRAIGMIGHELRNPLTSVQVITEMLASDKLSSTDREELLQTLHPAVRQLTNMAVNMLEAARLDSGLARWHWQAVSLEQVCRESFELLRHAPDGGNASLAYAVTPPDLRINGDADAIRQLLFNLVGNAQKHTQEGSILVSMRPATDDDHVELIVEDTGCGMSPEQMRSLGRAFSSNSGSVAADCGRGAGLGMAICKHIVAAHGGCIRVHSEKGVGTRFSVLLHASLPAPSPCDDARIEIESSLSLKDQ